MKTIVKKDPKIWEWQVIQGRKVIAGGYGRTKKDATNDLNVWLRPNAGTQRPGTPDGSLATETRKPGSLHPVVQPTRPWTHEQETEEMLRDCGRPEIRTCVECGENAPETGHICDECREQNGLL